jgi:hypothetical protein
MNEQIKYDGKDLLIIGKVNVFSIFKKLNYAMNYLLRQVIRYYILGIAT